MILISIVNFPKPAIQKLGNLLVYEMLDFAGKWIGNPSLIMFFFAIKMLIHGIINKSALPPSLPGAGITGRTGGSKGLNRSGPFAVGTSSAEGSFTRAFPAHYHRSGYRFRKRRMQIHHLYQPFRYPERELRVGFAGAKDLPEQIRYLWVGTALVKGSFNRAFQHTVTAQDTGSKTTIGTLHPTIASDFLSEDCV